MLQEIWGHDVGDAESHILFHYCLAARFPEGGQHQKHLFVSRISDESDAPPRFPKNEDARMDGENRPVDRRDAAQRHLFPGTGPYVLSSLFLRQRRVRYFS